MFRVACALPILALASVSAAAPSGGHPETIFQCSFGKKQVSITRAGPLYLYAFGLPGHPEIRVVGDPSKNNVFVSGDFGTLDGIKNLRIANGRYSYIVFFEGLTKDYETAKASAGSGLAVFDGSKQISKFECKGGMGFHPNWEDSDTPPDDPADFEVS